MSKIVSTFVGTELSADYEAKIAAVAAYWFGATAVDAAGSRGDIRMMFKNLKVLHSWESNTLEAIFRAELNWWNNTGAMLEDIFAPIVALDAQASHHFSDQLDKIMGLTGQFPMSVPGTTIDFVADASRPIALGAELITDFSFDVTAGWSAGAGWSVAGGKATKNLGGNSAVGRANSSLIGGRPYMIETSILALTAGQMTPRFIGGANITGTARTAAGTYKQMLIANAGHTSIDTLGTSTTVGEMDYQSVKEITSPVMGQQVAAAKPIWGRAPKKVTNLAKGSQDSTDWLGLSGATKPVNVVQNVGGFSQWMNYAITGVYPARACTPSIPVKANQRYKVTFRLSKVQCTYLPSDAGVDFYWGQSGSWCVRIKVDRANWTIGAYSNGGTVVLFETPPTLVDKGDIVEVSFVAYPTQDDGFVFGLWNVTGTPSGNVFVTGIQVERVENTGNYQAVSGNGLDIAEAGLPSFGFMRFDNVDDKMLRPFVAAFAGKLALFGRAASQLIGIDVPAGLSLPVSNTTLVGDVVDIAFLPSATTPAQVTDLLDVMKEHGALDFLPNTDGVWTQDLENGYKPGVVADFMTDRYKAAWFDTALKFDDLLTFSRSGLATMWDKDGKLKWDAHNALWNSGFIGAAAGTPGTWPTGWSLGFATGQIVSVTPELSLGGNSCRLSAAGTRQVFRGQDMNVVVGQTVCMAVRVEAYLVGTTVLENIVRLSGGTAGFTRTWKVDGVDQPSNYILPVGVHFIENFAAITSAGTISTQFGVGVVSGCTADIRFWAPRYYQLDLGGMAVNPDLPADPTYVPTPVGAAKYLARRHSHLYDGALGFIDEGALIDGAATNLLTFCRDFTNAAWVKDGVPTLTPGVGYGPDGLSTGTRLTSLVANAVGVHQDFTATAANHTLWAIVEKGVSDWCYLAFAVGGTAGNRFAWFNLTTGNFGTVQSLVLGTHKLRLYRNPTSGNDVWLIGITVLGTAATASGYIRMAGGDNDSIAAIGNDLILYWAEVELGSVPTSLKPSLGATPFARPADTLTIAADKLLFNPAGVTLAIEGKMNYADDGSAIAVRSLLWQADASNLIQQYIDTSAALTGKPIFSHLGAATNRFVMGADKAYAPGLNVPISLASRHGPAFINGAHDGVALTADVTPIAFPNLAATSLQIAPTFNGHIKSLRQWGADIGDAGIRAATLPNTPPLFVGVSGADFDLSTVARVFQTNGDVPVSAPGQAVGNIYDDIRGAALGAELVANTAPNFNVVNPGSTAYTPGVTIVVGKAYLVDFTISANPGTTSASWRIAGSAYNPQRAVPTGFVGRRQFVFIAAAAGSFALNADNTGTNLTIALCSIKEVTLPVMQQVTTAAQSLWGKAPASRRNILKATTRWDASEPLGWTGGDDTKRTAVTMSNGRPGIRFTPVLERPQLNQNVLPFEGGKSYTLSVYVDAGAVSTAGNHRIMEVRGTAAPIGKGMTYADLDDRDPVTGIVKMTFTPPVTVSVGTSVVIGPGVSNTATADITFGEPQLEVGGVRTAYQEIGLTDIDMTEAGVPSYGFARPDLVDDTFTVLCPQAVAGELLIFGRNGSWYETVSVAAGGTLTIGPIHTPTMPGMLRALGDIVDIIVVGRVLTGAEKSALMTEMRAKGANNWLVEGAELLTNTGFASDLAGWSATSGAVIAWNAGAMEVTRSGSTNHRGYQGVTGQALGRAYILRGTGGGTNPQVRVSPTNSFTSTLFLIATPVAGGEVFVASGSDVYVGFGGSADGVSNYDNVSLKPLTPAADDYVPA